MQLIVTGPAITAAAITISTAVALPGPVSTEPEITGPDGTVQQ